MSLNLQGQSGGQGMRPRVSADFWRGFDSGSGPFHPVLYSLVFDLSETLELEGGTPWE